MFRGLRVFVVCSAKCRESEGIPIAPGALCGGTHRWQNILLHDKPPLVSDFAKQFDHGAEVDGSSTELAENAGPRPVLYFAGDLLVLAASGAKEINEQMAPQVMNVVREMAIAGNVPMPRVYVINDTAPNAFATGRDPNHASVAMTTGLLEKLDREELQGVIGHEMSHVRNLDIRFALLVAVLVGSIALLSDFFLRFTFWGGLGGRRGGGRDRDGGGGLAPLRSS